MPSALANRRRAIAACSQKLKSSTEKYIYARGLLLPVFEANKTFSQPDLFIKSQGAL